MNLTIGRGVDLRLGAGLFRFRLSIHGRHGYLIRIPFIGKVWRYGLDYSGWTSWAEV